MPERTIASGALPISDLSAQVISFVNVYSSPSDIFLAILAFLLIVLLVRPQGILGSKEVRRV